MSKQITVPAQIMPHFAGLPLPDYQTAGAAGMDLLAAVEDEVKLAKGAFLLVPTGIKIALPVGFEAQIRPRSGLAAKHGVTLLNSPGTIDSDYRGEIQVILINHGEADFIVRRGMRIAQMVIAPVFQARLKPVLSLAETKRNEEGFGHTGL